MTAKPIISYKGFDPDFKCRDFQFEVGQTYKVEGKIVACGNGFHACENPFDVLSYYGFVGDNAKLNRFALVEQSGDIDKHSGDSKIASEEITIKAELKLPEFIRAAVDWIVDSTRGAGYNARIGSSGNYARIGSSGDNARIGSSGDNARIGSSGDDARIGSSGDDARIVSSGQNAVIACAGRSAVSAEAGSWISLAEYNDSGECVGFVSGCFGKNGLKPGTAYIAKGGKFVEA